MPDTMSPEAVEQLRDWFGTLLDYPQPRKWVDIPAAAKHLGLNPRTVERAIAAGEIPAYRIGKKLIRVDLYEVDALVAGTPVNE